MKTNFVVSKKSKKNMLLCKNKNGMHFPKKKLETNFLKMKKMTLFSK